MNIQEALDIADGKWAESCDISEALNVITEAYRDITNNLDVTADNQFIIPNRSYWRINHRKQVVRFDAWIDTGYSDCGCCTDYLSTNELYSTKEAAEFVLNNPKE